MGAKDIAKRIGQIVIVLFGISFITFLLTYLAPGDPVRIMFASQGNMPSEEIINQTRHELGLDQPFLVQYFNWLGGVLHGDFGTSISQKAPVGQLLLSRLGPTLVLATGSLVLMLVFAIPLGMLAAVKKNSVIDYIIRALTFVGISMPNFWVGLLLIYIFAMQLGLVPVVSSQMTFQQLILPCVTLAFVMTAKYTRQVRTAVLEELNQDYVTGAKARGVSKASLYWKQIFPNSFLPLITLLGLSIGSLLGGTAVVEVIFGYPGLGNLAVSAIKAMDYPIIQGYVLWVALIYMVVNLVVDISYGLADPRIRERRD